MEKTIGLVEIKDILEPYIDQTHCKMVFYRNRLNTFSHNWPFLCEKTSKCTPEQMANAGFYSISQKRGDTSCKCFCCLKELEGWEEPDDPLIEHRKHQPQCTFVQLNKNEKKWNLEDWIDLHASMANKLQEIKINEDIEDLQNELLSKKELLMKERKKRK